MILKQLELSNWRKLGSFSHTFKPGVTCILGANGTGKSSLLAAIKYSITGSWGSDYSKDQNITFKAKGASYVRAQWQHHDLAFTVTQFIRGGKPTLKLANRDDEPVTGAREIAAKLEQLLGVSANVLLEMVFVDQNCLTEFIDNTKANWLESVSKLCDLERLAKLYNALSVRLNSDKVLGGTVVDQRTELQQAIDLAQQDIAQCKQQLQEKSAHVLPAAKVKAYKAHLAGHELYTRREALLDKIKQRAAKLQLRQARMEDLTAKLANLTTRLTAANKFCEVAENGLLDSWMKTLNSVDNNRKLVTRKENLEKQVAEFGKEITAAKAQLATLETSLATSQKQETSDYGDVTALKAEVSAIEEDLRLYADGKCPTCRQPIDGFTVDNAQHRLQQGKQKLAQASAKYAKTQAEVQALQDNQTTIRSNISSLDRQLAAVTKELNRVVAQSVSLPTAEELAKAKTQITKYGVERSVRDKLQPKYAKLKPVVDSYNEVCRVAEAKLVRLSTWLAEHRRPQISAEKLTKRLQQHAVATANVSVLQANLVAAEKRLEPALQALANYEEVCQKYALGNKWLQSLESWRSVVHRDALPTLMMRGYLEDVMQKMNRSLHRFSAPFRLSLDADMEFEVTTTAGVKHKLRQLSGGQRVLMAMAYRLAVNDKTLLVLDEPTANLDQASLRIFSEFLARLNVTFVQQQKQLLLVTHETMLVDSTRTGDVFSDVVRL